MFSSPKAQTPRDKRNIRLIGLTQVVWLACLIANGSTFEHYFPDAPRAFLALLQLAAGAVVIWAYARFIRNADDLQKAIQLGALAIGFGVLVVFTLAYPAIERLGMPHLEPNHFVAIGVLGYALAVVFYSYRYK